MLVTANNIIMCKMVIYLTSNESFQELAWNRSNRNRPVIWQWISRSFLYCDSYAKRGICRRRTCVCPSVCVCVCVCVSVTIRYCIKTAKRRITQIMPHNSPLTLVFWHQCSLRKSNGITPYGSYKCRWSGFKLVTFHEKRAITRKRYKIDA